MRLTAIKLAGFKSFVDPTTFRAPTNLTGIVGPNGCGKSNIIDAVRWVMGEGSARVLRGEQMADVIFSGSSARKPVGTATVELVFDNSDGRVSGEYAGYNEISVKRTVGRDGLSQYYLNGARCRRKDITDLFLGTGLGSRSYSIIEQGMISEIVEARPEELRAHLEEAAGISRYKERRKETENRIRHTRENLDRLGDLREEVGNHLARLKRQAKAAERYRKLKQQRREMESRMLALQWRQLHAEAEAGRAQLAAREAELEEQRAVQRKAEAELEKLRSGQAEATEAFNAVQGELYAVGSEIARLEQTIQHERDLRERRAQERAEARQSLAEIEQHMGLDRAQVEELTNALADAEPRLESARTTEAEAAESAHGVETRIADWQKRIDAHHEDSRERHREADRLRARIEGLEQRLTDASARLAELAEAPVEEQADQGVAEAGEALRDDASAARAAEQAAQDELTALQARREKVTTALKAGTDNEHELQRRRHAAEGRLESLQAMRAAALDDADAGTWLEQQGLDPSRRLAGELSVEKGWETAVETVLGHWLDAVLAENPAAHAVGLAERAGGLALVSDSPGGSAPDHSLAARVEGPASARALLAEVQCAEDASQAVKEAASLDHGASVITPEGLWLGASWARGPRGGQGAGALVREQDIRALEEGLAGLREELREQVEANASGRESLAELESRIEAANVAINARHRERTEADSRLQRHQEKIEEARERRERHQRQQQQLESQQAEDKQKLSAARKELESTLARMADIEKERAALDQERGALLAERERAREALKAAREARHELSLKVETRRASLESLRQSLARMDAQFAQLQQRFDALKDAPEQDESPEQAHREAMDGLLQRRAETEAKLAEARRRLEQIDEDHRAQDKVRQAAVQQADEVRASLERARLGQQEIELNARAVARQVEQLEADVQAIAAELPEDADPESWEADMERLQQRITRLEPVNLAAIQEYEEELKRKEYLDAQNDDLCEALATLEAAIAKIDRQTRTRFKDTFERVNKGVQELFPRLFGGGHAYLEMTGDDLLTTGVSIMARPPGKRVSSIHLLSGGEKALTAAAFVFSIFQLNPAPFCLLDEVDAPLDDANVGRFSALVREMSESVQFVIVTHNKITMEMVHQLSGVTMREPGVSRLVQVDLEEAAQLAEA